MTVERLCELIDLQDEVKNIVLDYEKTLDFSALNECIDKLGDVPDSINTLKALVALLGEDEQRMKMLTCFLKAAAGIHDWYEENGVSEEIYVDTMKCFTRFIDETYRAAGKYMFDRFGWTPRQVGAKLFRIGELEYELLENSWEYDKVISVHIPSDAVFTKEACDESLAMAGQFMAQHFPEFSDCDYVCESWLLSPELDKLLPPQSNILNFAHRFEIMECFPDSKDFFLWVFKCSEKDVAKLPENTSLQRKTKQLLLDGGNVGAARGKMKR